MLSVAVEGLWKWALNVKSEPANNVFDRFWNQLLLNLLSRSSTMLEGRVLRGPNGANDEEAQGLALGADGLKLLLEAMPAAIGLIAHASKKEDPAPDRLSSRE